MDNNNVPRQLTAEAAAQLQEGISLVFSRWTALQMAVENEWGGRGSRQKSHQLVLDIVSAFTNPHREVYIEDLKVMLNDLMDSLETVVEDDIEFEEIALKLMYMNEECLEGNFNSIKLLRETNGQRSAPTYFRQGASDDDDDDDISDDSGDGNENLGENASDMAIDAMEPQSNLGRDLLVDSTLDQQAEMEEDGWTKVSSRRNRGRKN